MPSYEEVMMSPPLSSGGYFPNPVIHAEVDRRTWQDNILAQMQLLSERMAHIEQALGIITQYLDQILSERMRDSKVEPRIDPKNDRGEAIMRAIRSAGW